jgi:hypothetical protein
MEDDNTQNNHTHQSGSRINIIPLIIIIGIIFVLFRYDLSSITKNLQLNKNINYVKTTVLDYWHKISPTGSQSLFSQFFKTNNLNPVSNTPGITDFINSFKGVDSISGAKDVVEDKAKKAVAGEVTKQVNTWANSKELNTTNEIVPTQ